MPKTDTIEPFITFDATWAQGASTSPALPDTEARALITIALRSWIDSPSKSILQALAARPEPGKAVFTTHLDQTRFLIALRNAIGQMRNLPKLYHVNPDTLPKLPPFSTVIRNGNHIKIANDAAALTLHNRSDPTMQIILRTLHAYASQQKNKNPRPRPLYRGLRLQHLHHEAPAAHDILASLPNVEATFEKHTDHCQKNLALRLIRQIIGQYVLTRQPLANLCQSGVLSFTTREETARYFTKKQGIIISTRNWAETPEVISSPTSEDILREPDPVSGRQENLTILRIPQDMILPENSLTPYDFDYFHATGDIRAINALDTPYVSITYEIEGRRVTKTVSYINNHQTRACYRHENDYGHGLRDFTRKYGFSPTITAANSKQARIISISSCQPYSDKTKTNNPLPQDMVEQLQEQTKDILRSRMG